MNYEILPNGNLKISTEDQGDLDDLLLARLRGVDDTHLWTLILDITNEDGNGRFAVLAPEDIGALTEAPIIADAWDVTDDGRKVLLPESRVWWFPDYAVTDAAGVLATKGAVVFAEAHE